MKYTVNEIDKIIQDFCCEQMFDKNYLCRHLTEISSKSCVETNKCPLVLFKLYLQKMMEEKDGLEEKVQEYINNHDTRVEIVHSNETGEWVYAVCVADDDFWLDSFETEKEALEYIAKNNLKTVREDLCQ